MSERHPYAGHPAAPVLADHQPECVTKATPPAAPVMCCCGVMVAWCDFSAHQTGMLHQAGLLAPDPTAHVYLSTGCLHGDHDYCQATVGGVGRKAPATCKFCGAPCVCDCHEKQGEQ